MNYHSKSLLRIGAALATAVFLFLALFAALNPTVQAAPDDNTYQVPPFSQNWTDTSLITTNDDWSGVPGIIGYLGDSLTALTGADPQTILAEGTGTVDVIANQTNPNTLTSGGVAEFEITDPVVAFQGSGTADAPFVLIHLDTTGLSNIQVAYNLRDIDGSVDNAIQPVALQYRVGNSGDFTNLPDGFVADATTGPSLATLVTPVTVTLPAAADNQSQVQIRIITTNAVGSDEWVGIDDLSITSVSVGPDLAMSKSVEPATAVPYQSAVTYTVVLENNGAVSETAVLFTDTLPISTTFGAWVEQPAGVSVVNDEITWTGTVTNGEAITFTFTADQTADYSATITNTAEFSGTTTGIAQAAFTVESTAGDVTFVYHDLEDVVQTGEGLFLAGDFNGWNTTSTPLTADGSYETFSVTVPALSVGAYNYKYVVYTDTIASGSPEYDWLNTNNRSYNVLGTATVDDYRNVVPGYAVLSGPATLTVTQTFSAGPISGELYINNVTNPAGEGRGLKAQVGFGSSVDPGVWTWFDAAFTVQAGNNDVFAGSITPPAPGVFSYTNRFNGNWGTGNPNSVWSYGDLNGVHPGNPFELTQTGVITVEAAGVCEINPSHLIHEIQGSGASSPISGQAVTVQAVVVSNFQGGSGTLNGFHVQEEVADQDSDPTTSEGIFVFNSTPVTVGDLVHVAGTVSEFNGLTELGSATVTQCSQGNVITPALVTLPLATGITWERYENMLLELQNLTATDNFRLGRFGQVRLATHRLAQPTNVVLPGAPAIALQALNNLSYITLDDARTFQNVDPMVYPAPELTYTNTLRGGDSVAQLIGVIDHYTADSSDDYRLQPTQPVSFTAVNLRQERPDVGGTIQVASFNVLNYFSTLDDGVNDICGPLANQECRGADSALEFERQYTKIVNALVEIDAAVVGLMEIENHADDEAVIDLVTRLNIVAGGVYTYVNTGVIGTDAIKQALIYQPALVTPVGTYKILDSSVDPDFDDTRNRPTIIQTFEENSSGERFTVAVNHLKSKGSACTGDPDLGDGQGNCNVTRTEAAQALVDYLATDPTNSGSDRFLIIGDMNSYAMEDPIRAIEAAGYTNLVNLFGGLNAYGYQFDGQWGYLDHGLASNELVPFVTDSVEWHLNADEPTVFDYNTEFKSANQVNIFYSPEPFRSSDHDPVLVGLDLTPVVTPTIEILTPTDGQVFTSTNGTAVSVPVTITTTDFVIPTDGHWHVWVDGVNLGPVMDYDTSVDLLPGTHVISAELNTPAHLPLGVADSVSVTVVEAPEEPTITILSPMAGDIFTSTNGTAVSIPVTITTTDFVIPTDGHWHLWIDGVDTGPVMDYETTFDLLPGAHVISAELNSPSHVSLGFSDSVSVTVNVQYILYLPVIMKP